MSRPDGYLRDGLRHDAEGPCGPARPGELLRYVDGGDEPLCPRCAAARPVGRAPLLSVDLGVRYLAAAAFWYGRLRAAARVAPDACALPRRWTPDVPVLVASAAIRWAGDGPFAGALYGPLLAIEVPQDYERRSAAQRDLGRMRLVGAELHRQRARRWSGVVPGATREPHPSAWKGNVPKPVHALRIRDALDPEERVIFDACAGDHDVLDAIGLGLWAVGRVGRGGIRR